MRIGLSGIDVEYSMARNGDRAILVIGRLLKTKTSVRMWGEDDDNDDDAKRVHTEAWKSAGCRHTIKATERSEPGNRLYG